MDGQNSAPIKEPEAAPQRRWQSFREAIEDAGEALPAALRRMAASMDAPMERSLIKPSGYPLISLARYVEPRIPAYVKERTALLLRWEETWQAIVRAYADLCEEGARQMDLMHTLDHLIQHARPMSREYIPPLTKGDETLEALGKPGTQEETRALVQAFQTQLLLLYEKRLPSYEVLHTRGGSDVDRWVKRTTRADATAGAVDGWEAYLNALEALQACQAEQTFQQAVDTWEERQDTYLDVEKELHALYDTHFPRDAWPFRVLAGEDLGRLRTFVP